MLLSASPAFAQVVVTPQLQICVGATEGSPTTPWLLCPGGIKFGPISDSAMVATGDFNRGTWRVFGKIPGDTMVAVCWPGAILASESACRTADNKTWATQFVRKDALPGIASWRITFRWELVTLYDDSSPITAPVTYVLTWYGTDALGVANTPNTDTETAGPPLVVSVPQQRICARVRARVSGVLSEPSQEVCITPKERAPGVPMGVTVEFGEP